MLVSCGQKSILDTPFSSASFERKKKFNSIFEAEFAAEEATILKKKKQP